MSANKITSKWWPFRVAMALLFGVVNDVISLKISQACVVEAMKQTVILITCSSMPNIMRKTL